MELKLIENNIEYDLNYYSKEEESKKLSIDDIIEKNLNCIKLFKTPNNQIPLFNGASVHNLGDFDKYLEKIKSVKKEKKFINLLLLACVA